jgi:hypothetical protein
VRLLLLLLLLRQCRKLVLRLRSQCFLVPLQQLWLWPLCNLLQCRQATVLLQLLSCFDQLFRCIGVLPQLLLLLL